MVYTHTHSFIQLNVPQHNKISSIIHFIQHFPLAIENETYDLKLNTIYSTVIIIKRATPYN